MSEPITDTQVTVVPANVARWDDLVAIFGTTGAGRCQCQRFLVRGWMWGTTTLEERTASLRAQAGCDDPAANTTSGLVAYVDGEPAGWAAVQPRVAYPKLQGSPVPWKGRDEDRADASVWSVTCLVVRKAFRGRGLTYHLAAATVPFAAARGARALEAYPMITEPFKRITWGETHVGTRQVFEEAGFTQVSHPTPRRVVMRVELR